MTKLKFLRICFFFLPLQIYVTVLNAPLGIVYIPLFFLFLFTLLEGLKTKKLLLVPSLNFLIFIVICSSILSEFPLVAFRKTFTIIFSALVYHVVINLDINDNDIKDIFNTIIKGSVLVGIIGVFIAGLFSYVDAAKAIWLGFIQQYGAILYGESFMETINNLNENNMGFFSRGYEGWFSDINLVRNVSVFKVHYEAGFYSIIIIIIAIFKYLETKSKFYFFIIILFIINLFTTYSRSSYFAFMVSIILIYKNKNILFLQAIKVRRIIIGFILAIFILGVIIPGSPIESVYSGIYKLFNNPNETDLDFRLSVMNLSSDSIVKNPFLGLGKGVFEYSKYNSFTRGYHAHYGPIIILTDIGIIGLFALLYFFFIHLKKANYLIKCNINNYSLLGQISRVIIITLMCGFIFADFFTSSKLLPFIFLILGLTNNAYTRYKNASISN